MWSLKTFETLLSQVAEYSGSAARVRGLAARFYHRKTRSETI